LEGKEKGGHLAAAALAIDIQDGDCENPMAAPPFVLGFLVGWWRCGCLDVRAR